MIPEVHLTTRNLVSRENKRRAHLLNENSMPIGKSPAEIIKWLNVKNSLRYEPNRKDTYCNIYAYDYCHLMGAYMPRVWWTDSVIKNKDFRVVYGRTVRELNANSLCEWFSKFGKDYGWHEVKTDRSRKIFDKTEAQKLANEGICVVMLAANKDPKRSGHIVCIVPENNEFKSVGAGGITVYPLMSQAGRRNKSYFSDKWWGGLKPYTIWYNTGVVITP